MDRGGSGGDAGGSELQRAVDRATRDTPYMVVSTEKGFDVGLRLADARWRQFFGSAVLRQTFRWKVTEKNSRYSITDESSSVRWAAPGVPRLDFSGSKQSGRILSLSRDMIWAPTVDGGVVPVADYRFDSSEGRDLIRLVGKKLLIAAALLLTTAVIAGALATWLMSGVFRAQPPAATQFPGDGSTSVELRAGETKTIYVDNAGSPPQRVDCRGAAPESATSAVTIEPVAGDITVNSWRAAFTVTAGAPGTYAFTCTGSPGDIFGVGGHATGGRIGSSVALILLAGATGLAGLITGVLGLVRRRRSRP